MIGRDRSEIDERDAIEFDVETGIDAIGRGTRVKLDDEDEDDDDAADVNTVDKETDGSEKADR